MIGHQEFLSEQQRSFSARSITISHFVYVRKAELFHLFEKFPLDYVTNTDNYGDSSW